MEAVSTSKTSVNFYETTCCNTPEDSRPHIRSWEDQISRYKYLVFSVTRSFVTYWQNLSIDIVGSLLTTLSVAQTT
jgi:hypothetical protein